MPHHESPFDRHRDRYGDYGQSSRGERFSQNRTGAHSRGGIEKRRVEISRSKRNIHVFFEALGVFVVAPFSVYLATRKELPDWARNLAGVIAGTTIVVDGGLLLSYLKEDKRKERPPE